MTDSALTIDAHARARYESPREWIKDCQALVRKDLDNVVLFTGEEGAGKSNLALQIMHALDNDFSVERITYDVDPFIEVAQETPQFASVLADELLINKRKGMHGPTLRLLDFLQRCRYLNLHMGICFPRESLMEKAVLQERVRWNWHTPKRGLAILRKPVKRQIRNRKGEAETIFGWREMGRWKVGANTGQLWQDYLVHKKQFTFARDKGLTGEEAIPPAKSNGRARCPNCDVACRAIYVKPDSKKAPKKKQGWVECPNCENLFRVS